MNHYTMKDMMRILDITKNTIINWEREGKIPARRDDVFGHRYWKEGDLKAMKKLCEEIRGRDFEHHKGLSIYIYSPKDGKWKYQCVIHKLRPNDVYVDNYFSKDIYSSKSEALRQAQLSIEEKLKKITGRG